MLPNTTEHDWMYLKCLKDLRKVECTFPITFLFLIFLYTTDLFMYIFIFYFYFIMRISPEAGLSDITNFWAQICPQNIVD